MEIKIDENWKKERLFLIYVNFGIGNITFNFWPKAVNELLINLVVYKKLFIGSDSNERKMQERDFIKELTRFQRTTGHEKGRVREDAKKVVTYQNYQKATPRGKYSILSQRGSLEGFMPGILISVIRYLVRM